MFYAFSFFSYFVSLTKPYHVRCIGSRFAIKFKLNLNWWNQIKMTTNERGKAKREWNIYIKKAESKIYDLDLDHSIPIGPLVLLIQWHCFKLLLVVVIEINNNLFVLFAMQLFWQKRYNFWWRISILMWLCSSGYRRKCAMSWARSVGGLGVMCHTIDGHWNDKSICPPLVARAKATEK